MGNAGLMALMMMLIWCGIGVASAAVYTVGESSGWSMGSDYSTWASDKTFEIGDTLVFNYAPGHSVDEVSESDYKSCTTGNAITSDSSGATSITLKTGGAHYYICGIPGHCGGGMKLAVTVAEGSSTTTSPSSGTTIAMPPASPPSTTGMPPITAAFPPSTTTSPTLTTRGAATEEPSSSTTFTPYVALFFSFFFALVKVFML